MPLPLPSLSGRSRSFAATRQRCKGTFNASTDEESIAGSSLVSMIAGKTLVYHSKRLPRTNKPLSVLEVGTRRFEALSPEMPFVPLPHKIRLKSKGCRSSSFPNVGPTWSSLDSSKKIRRSSSIHRGMKTGGDSFLRGMDLLLAPAARLMGLRKSVGPENCKHHDKGETT